MLEGAQQSSDAQFPGDEGTDSAQTSDAASKKEPLEENHIANQTSFSFAETFASEKHTRYFPYTHLDLPGFLWHMSICI